MNPSGGYFKTFFEQAQSSAGSTSPTGRDTRLEEGRASSSSWVSSGIRLVHPTRVPSMRCTEEVLGAGRASTRTFTTERRGGRSIARPRAGARAGASSRRPG
jgi:hypothetical protein